MATTKKEIVNLSGTGRRKSAIARATLKPGTGKITLTNWVELNDDAKKHVIAPLKLASLQDKFDVAITVSGGGVQSRLDAIRLAIARALIKHDPELKTILRKSGYMTRDPREKERKKPGLKRARRAPQWAKR